MTIHKMIALKVSLLANGTFGEDIYKCMLEVYCKPIIEKRVKAKIMRKKLKAYSRGLVAMLKDIEQHGFFCIEWWSRDCDCVESTRYVKYTSIEEFNASCEDIGDWAEGPVTCEHVDASYADEPTHTRDRVMEAYENTGQGYHV